MRAFSAKESTRKLAAMLTLFGDDRQPETSYLLGPSVSSERMAYVPIGFLTDTVASNLVFSVPNAQLFHFAILCSHMHMAWMRCVSGRLKSDFHYSNTIVYNNFPWPNIVNLLPKMASNKATSQLIRA